MARDGDALEVAGKSVEDAIEKGLVELGLARDQVDIQVLSQGSRGVLGLGAEEARVLLTPAPPSSPEIEEAPEVRKEEPTAVGEDLAKVAQTGEEAVRTILDKIGVTARVTTSERRESFLSDEASQPSLVVDIEGDDLGLLIGRRGETLRDLQFLVRLVVSRKTRQWANVTVDVGHYKARRERQLSSLARSMAEKVSVSKQAFTLEPMPPAERRIIHLSLRDHPHVITRSVGEDERRKVMILPKQ
jgi:spoIIIJ-associated protein